MSCKASSFNQEQGFNKEQAVCPLLGLADTGFLWNDSPEGLVAGNPLFLSYRPMLVFKAFVWDS